MNRAERLDKIINAIQAYACNIALIKPSSWIQSTKKLHPDDAKEEIMALFMECVPRLLIKKVTIKPGKESDSLVSEFYAGFNECRDVTLRNIEELRGG